jgi:hypothetical protein
MVARFSTALCPFARNVLGDNTPSISHEKLNDILKRIKEHVPQEGTHRVEKRDLGFNVESQLLDVTGDHTWQAPGPDDMSVKTTTVL